MLRDQSWVLTGAGGRIASILRPYVASQVRRLRLVDVVPVARYSAEESVVADLRDPDTMLAALAQADGVLHLGGLADEATFNDLVDANIRGTFNALEAARRSGVKRFVYASSSRVTGLYPVTTRVAPDMPARPDGLYGVSKVAGEALGRMYAEKLGLSVITVRIGSAEDVPHDERQLSTWLSPRDCRAAFGAAMRVRDVRYAVFYAVSRNQRRWWDLAPGQALGYHPIDDAERHAAGVAASSVSAPAGFQGGAYATPSYTLRYLEPECTRAPVGATSDDSQAATIGSDGAAPLVASRRTSNRPLDGPTMRSRRHCGGAPLLPPALVDGELT